MTDKPRSRDDESLNFEKIEKELDSAMTADQRYWRENDAKFRAVHQKVATYEEFRDIVKASHIKPLEKGDKMDSVTFNQPWNIAATKNSDNSEKQTTGEIGQSKNIPKSGQEFVQYWRRYLKSLGDQYAYLLSIGGDNLSNIFKTEISFGLLGDIIKALENKVIDSEAESVLCVLEGLSRTNRFSLSVQFLSSKEKEICRSLMEKIKRHLNETNSQLISNLDKLEEVYELKKS